MLPCCRRHSWRLATTFCTLLYRSPPCMLICFVHCVWPSCSSVLSFLWCCQTMISSVCLFSFFLQPCLLQSVEWVGCHCLSLCDQSKPVLKSLSFLAIPFWHQAHWECWHLFFSLSDWHLTFSSRSTFLLPWSCSHRIWRGSRLLLHKWVHSTLELWPALLWGLWIGFCYSKWLLLFLVLIFPEQAAVAVFVEPKYLKLSTCSTFSPSIVMLCYSFRLPATINFCLLEIEFQVQFQVQKVAIIAYLINYDLCEYVEFGEISLKFDILSITG